MTHLLTHPELVMRFACHKTLIKKCSQNTVKLCLQQEVLYPYTQMK